MISESLKINTSLTVLGLGGDEMNNRMKLKTKMMINDGI